MRKCTGDEKSQSLRDRIISSLVDSLGDYPKLWGFLSGLACSIVTIAITRCCQ